MTNVPSLDEPVGPVFVDPSGRRARWVRQVTWLLSAVMVGYITLVLVSLVAPAGSLNVPGLGPLLPGPAAGPLVDRTGRHRKPAQVFAPSPTASSAATGPTGAGTPTPAGSSGTPSPGTVGASPTGRPTAVATGAPTAGPTAPATPGSSPPGQASAHPTPRSTHKRP